MSSTMKLLFVLITLSLASALDVELTGVQCDSSLPVSAEIILECDGSSRCTFNKAASVYGTMIYNGLEDSSVADEVAYITADLSLWTLSFNLFKDLAIPLCSDDMTANEGYECPADGSYNFAVTYTLPDAGPENQSWLASGWEGSGEIKMYASENSDTMVGYCSLSLSTFVTPKSGRAFQTPAASLTFAMALASLVACALLCIGCCCCRKKRVSAGSRDPSEDKVMDFRRMTEETNTPAFVSPEVRVT